MKNFWLTIFIYSLIYLLCLVSINAQRATRTPTPQQEAQRTREAQQQELNRLKKVGEQQQASVLTKREALPFKAKRTAEQRKRLEANAEDLSRYSAFLRQPKTGIVKIFSDIGCEDNADVIRADADCLNSIPNSAFYSFREKEHTNEYLADIRVKENFFVSDGILSQGILVSLGNVTLENLSLESEGIEFLIEFAPESNSKDALKQTNQIIKGVRAGKFVYKKTLPIIENTTYAMRVIAYRGKFRRVFRGNLYNVLEGDERADLIIGFRVVRKSDDGSVTVIWKELQRKAAPKIIFPKKNKQSKNKI